MLIIPFFFYYHPQKLLYIHSLILMIECVKQAISARVSQILSFFLIEDLTISATNALFLQLSSISYPFIYPFSTHFIQVISQFFCNSLIFCTFNTFLYFPKTTKYTLFTYFHTLKLLTNIAHYTLFLLSFSFFRFGRAIILLPFSIIFFPYYYLFLPLY